MNTTLSFILPGILLIVNIILIIIVVNLNKRSREEQRFLLQELQRLNRENREDVTQSLSRFSDSLNQNFSLMRESSDKSMNMLGEIQKEKLDQIEKRQGELIINTEKKLEHIRATVEEKLEKTLSERLGRSFETVGKQLIEVQKGLGEMQVLAQDVGGLKRVLSNVKMRGGIGEVQLSMLLEQILAPEQYESNVKTKQSGRDFVEFAIKLPGKEGHNKHVWLPVDAKFPKEYYETLQNAYDSGDLVLIEKEQKALENAIKLMAKDISEKYVNPPATTDFAIMFLPFEGIYAEVVRKAALLEEIQTKYKVLITGPTTFAAILNSLQMGFRTLAIEKRSGEVWNILGAVKKEFSTFGDLLQKAQKNIQGGLDDIDKLVGTRTRAIQRKLSSVETMGIPDVKLISDEETNALLPPSDEV
ncbi:MAG: DNA recombination protein RmuC [Bacteroidetes bacterium HGW-Bacteroidetes-6]|jgi:DNA recombination protein RmuC|nr:MAG: DNA recombination protein RmuC [Bacteroidetes bacterium HGW-Bacteroidetes-7]PKP04903.1 MAG: DNA recombination protein RmuC [Bacteroidetes bacterium HGW-Bacteroidetes-6]